MRTINNSPLEQVNHFKYHRCEVGYESDSDIKYRISKFSSTSRTTHIEILENKTRNCTSIKLNMTIEWGRAKDRMRVRQREERERAKVTLFTV